MKLTLTLCLVGLGLVSTVTGCSVDASEGKDDVSTSAAAATSATTVAQLRTLIGEGRVMFDDVTTFALADVQVVDSQRTEDLGVVNIDSLVRLPSGAVINVLQIDGPVGSHLSDGAIFRETRHFLVLDAAGLSHVAKNARRTPVRGERREQLVEVFERTPHPSSPSEPLWGDNPFFAWPNGEAVAFIGSFYARTNDGKITRYSLASDSFDPLDQ
jgi:hypothetical protein